MTFSKVRRCLTAVAWSAALLAAQVCSAAEKPHAAAGKSTPASKPRAYLGLGVGSLHSPWSGHLGDILAEGQGVSVIDVLLDSPAAKAGIKRGDILATYGDQQLYSPEQLVKLIHNDRPGKHVTLGVVHHGKLHSVEVTLAEHPEAAPEVTPKQAVGFPFNLPWFDHAKTSDADKEAAAWRTFDSLTLSRLDGDNFKAEIRFRDDQGKIETHTFEGTRDELRKAIQAQKHLPENERRHLMRALAADGGIGGLRLLPDGEIIFDFRDLED